MANHALRFMPEAVPSGLAWRADLSELVVVDRTSGAITANDRLLVQVPDVELAAVALAGDALFATTADDRGRVFQVSGVHVRELAVAPAYRLGCAFHGGLLYATQFHVSRFGAHDGSVVVIDPETEITSTVLDGFHHPIGIAALGRTLVVADARARTVDRVELVAGRAVARFQLAALPDRPALVCAHGDDAVLVSSYDPTTELGTIRRIALDGRVTTIATGAWEPRGLACSASQVFVASPGIVSLPI